jgi:hypothetical protein
MSEETKYLIVTLAMALVIYAIATAFMIVPSNWLRLIITVPFIDLT